MGVENQYTPGEVAKMCGAAEAKANQNKRNAIKLLAANTQTHSFKDGVRVSVSLGAWNAFMKFWGLPLITEVDGYKYDEDGTLSQKG